MPNPVPLATREEEERRTWVTAHHEVVRLIKDCFGDRFSNNEIFDRLKISRRTGYRALGNDERIGKAPGRKPKITEATIQLMIEYIETGGCNDVGNVWKHLAEKFAPDCNPKTVQDAVKKSGFKNYRNSVKLEPLLREDVNENQPSPDEEHNAQLQQQQQQQQQQLAQQPTQPLGQQTQQVQQSSAQHQQTAVDPSFQQQSASRDILRQAIEGAHDGHIRYLLWDVCNRFSEAEALVIQTLCPYVVSAPISGMASSSLLPFGQHSDDAPLSVKRPRIAVCRRCGSQYDRSENTMENRQCLYHKGSPQKISPDEAGTIEQSPEAFIWSCCGGNGMVRGCCRAMHTTKKKRKYGKKRDASEAGLDDDGDGGSRPPEIEAAPPVETTETLLSNAQQSHLNETRMNPEPLDSSRLHRPPQLDPNQLEHPPLSQHHHHLENPNIDSSLEDLQSSHMPSHMAAMQVFGDSLQNYQMTAGHIQPDVGEQHTLNGTGSYPAHDHLELKHHAMQHDGLTQAHHLASDGPGLPHEFHQFAAVSQLGQQPNDAHSKIKF